MRATVAGLFGAVIVAAADTASLRVSLDAQARRSTPSADRSTARFGVTARRGFSPTCR